MPRGARWGGHGRELRAAALAAPILVVLMLAGLMAGPAAARAGEDTSTAAPPQVEAWGGGSASAHAIDAYSGTVLAPFGSLDQDGLRLRLQGGGGRYTYATTLPVDGAWLPVEVTGLTTRTDLLAGWQVSMPHVTTKLYAGARHITHRLAPADPGNSIAGERTGGLVLAEVWLEPMPALWLALDASYGTAFGEHAANAAAAWRLQPWLSTGLELGLAGDEGYEGGKAGLLVEADTALGTLRATAGITGARLEDAESYLALGLRQRF